MGVLTDLLVNADTIALDTPLSRHVRRQLEDIINELGDFDMPVGYGEADEVHSIAVHAAGTDAGTYKIKITLKSGLSFTTAALAYDANAAAILAAINTAAASVPGWTDGDIAVGGGPLSTDAVTLTFSGASVAGQNHGLTEIENVDLNDGGTPTDAGAVTVVTNGQQARYAWAALKLFGIIDSAPPEQGGDVGEVTVLNSRGNFPHKLSADTVKALIEEATFKDNNATVRTKLLAALGY